MRFLHLLCLLVIYSVTFSQNSNPFIAHEWGTFTMLSTAGGELLEGLTRSEEALPPFVYEVVQSKTYYDYWEKRDVSDHAIAIDVNARMETPVIYLYSEQSFSPEVNIQFQGGSITEWFPKTPSGENYLRPNQPGVALSAKTPFGNRYEVKLADDYDGFIDWKIDVLSPSSATSVSYPDSLNSMHWNAPRNTQSNIVRTSSGETEKFLFYRGIAHLKNLPIQMVFNTDGNLVIRNNTQETLPYIGVYEERGGNTYLYWTGPVYPESHQVVNMNTYSCQNCLPQFQDEFTKQLIASGLYEDEARAMLKTWEQSYFHSPGIKVFWIMPRSYIDPILQLGINPQPDQLERVFIGRSEILTPEFEKYLLSFGTEDGLKQQFEDDRFLYAYQDFYERGRLSELSDILESDNSKPTSSMMITHGINPWPNPTSGTFNGHLEPSPMPYQYPLTLQLMNGQGNVLHSQLLHNGTTDINISLERFSEGIYFFSVTGDDTRWSGTVVKH